MASTGEVASFGHNKNEAFLHAYLGSGGKIPQKGILLSIGSLEDKLEFIESAHTLMRLGYRLYATHGTCKIFGEKKVKALCINKLSEGEPHTISLMASGVIDLVINTALEHSPQEVKDGFMMRRKAIDSNVVLISDIKLAKTLVSALDALDKQGGMKALEVHDHTYFLNLK